MNKPNKERKNNGTISHRMFHKLYHFKTKRLRKKYEDKAQRCWNSIAAASLPEGSWD